MLFDFGRGGGGAVTVLTNILVLIHGIYNNKFGQNPSFFNPILLVLPSSSSAAAAVQPWVGHGLLCYFGVS